MLEEQLATFNRRRFHLPTPERSVEHSPVCEIVVHDQDGEIAQLRSVNNWRTRDIVLDGNSVQKGYKNQTARKGMFILRLRDGASRHWQACASISTTGGSASGPPKCVCPGSVKSAFLHQESEARPSLLSRQVDRLQEMTLARLPQRDRSTLAKVSQYLCQPWPPFSVALAWS